MKKQKRWNWLINTINEHGYRVGAELGAATGISTKQLLDNCSNLRKLVIVDIWKPIAQLDHPAGWGKDNMEEVFREKFKGDTRLQILKGLSWDMAEEVENKSLDFVFIDADHSFECVKKDIRAWYQKVRKGGMICGHDINLPGVFRAVSELLPGWKNSTVDNVWYWRKNK